MEKIYLEQYEDGDPCSSWASPACLTGEQVTELQSLIGEVIFMFNSVESSLDYTIADAVNDRSRIPGYAITAETSVFTKKIALFKSLLGMSVQSFNKEVIDLHNSLIKDLYKIKDIRNNVAHANWMSADSEYRVKLRLSTDEGGVFSVVETLSPEVLRLAINNIQKVLENLELFAMKIDDTRNLQSNE
jgi:hypothetical protein